MEQVGIPRPVVGVPRPLYEAVARQIAGLIETGEWGANSRLPSEAALIEKFGVGRNTVRHALSQLVDAGVLKTIQGVGTFVVDGRTAKTAQFLYGFSQEMALAGKRVNSEVLDHQLIDADATLARRLEVQLGSEVVFLQRLRKVDGEPTALERAYLPHRLFPRILDHDFSKESLYKVLSDEFDSTPDHAEQEIEASVATPMIAELLDLPMPAVVLVFHRVTRRRDGAVIEFVESELRADRFRFYTELKLRAGIEPTLFQRLPVRNS